jgi:hypothetical protein
VVLLVALILGVTFFLGLVYFLHRSHPAKIRPSILVFNS